MYAYEYGCMSESVNVHKIHQCSYIFYNTVRTQMYIWTYMVVRTMDTPYILLHLSKFVMTCLCDSHRRSKQTKSKWHKKNVASETTLMTISVIYLHTVEYLISEAFMFKVWSTAINPAISIPKYDGTNVFK